MLTSAAAASPPLPSSPRSEHLSWRVKLLYGMPNFAGAALVIPILINMPKFYADVVLVPLGYLAIAIAVARSLDAISDPVMGWISDRTKTRWGRRRPYLVLGAPLCGLAFYGMMNPPLHMSGEKAGLWFGATFILYFLCHTIYVLPHYALGPELTLDYNERTSLFGVRESFTVLGTIVAAAAPGLLMRLGMTEREAFSRLGLVFAILLTVLYWALAFGIRERPEFATRESNPFVPGVRRALRNKPFVILLVTYMVSSITGAIPATLLPFFNAYVIQPRNPALWLSILLLGYFGFAFICLPMWVWVSKRFGKLDAWLASFVMGITGGAAMFFLSKGEMAALMALMCWAGVSFGAGLVLASAIQADVIDYDELYTGRRREAQYTAFWSILPKFVAIPSAAIPIAVLASLGYVPNAVQSPTVILAIKSIFALAPAFCGVLAFFIAWRFPINERIHRQVLDGIERHARGESSVDPMTGRLVTPPSSRQVDEKVGWFLDNFSHGELKRYLKNGALAPIRDVWLAAGASIAVCLVCAFVAVSHLTEMHSDPGTLVLLSVVASGFALAVFFFHLLRLRPARELASGAVSAETIRSHLADG